MSIIPNIQCPTNYTNLVFRFIDCKNAGIVKGNETINKVDLSTLQIPISQHLESEILINPGATIQLPDFGSFTSNLERWRFQLPETYKWSIGTSHRFQVFVGNIEIITDFTVISSFINDFQTAIEQNPDLQGIITLKLSDNNIIFIDSYIPDTKLQYILNINKLYSYNSNLWEHQLYGDLINVMPTEKTLKYIMLLPLYENVDRKKCNCTNKSGEFLSNKKWIQYTNETSWKKWKKPSTGTFLKYNEIDLSLPNDKYTFYGIDPHYSFQIGDIVVIKSNNGTIRAKIYNIISNTIIFDTKFIIWKDTELLQLDKQPEWSKIGDILILSGGGNINDWDYVQCDRIVIKNPQTFTIGIKIMLGV